jgi:hypothetical protein
MCSKGKEINTSKLGVTEWKKNLFKHMERFEELYTEYIEHQVAFGRCISF